jgi:ribosomal protein S18 acetylase RimI-like enzyme
MSFPHAGREIVEQISGSDRAESLLDNPILNALLTEHQLLALSEGVARRYPAPIGPLAGAPNQSLESYEALGTVAGPGGILALFFPELPAPPSGWSLVRGGILTQMICRTPQLAKNSELAASTRLRRLGSADVPAMIELATLTEPGPFRERTIELGNFYGIFESDRLVAMAGQRMRVPGFVEVSAVCTHPDARGRGYAGILMSEVIRDIGAEGATPFLHAFADNPAIRLYEKLGFTHRRSFQLAVIKREP